MQHEQMIEKIISSRFKESLKSIRRIAIGICNEVYEVVLENRAVIARLSPSKRYLMGSHDHIPQFKKLGIKVPEILMEDYDRNEIPLCYQIQSKIDGEDLGQVIENLSENQLQALAIEIATIFQKVATFPSSDKFGVIWGGGDNELSDTWTERMKIWIEESKERGLKTGVMDAETEKLSDYLYTHYKSYFDSIKPTTYYGDICSKNVMIHHGAFNGLVDLDGLTQGDPLEAIGRIKLSWYGTPHGTFYTEALMNALELAPEKRKMVIVYALFNQISWMCENGIQFNQNTTEKVDLFKKAKDKILLKKLHLELLK
jgi:aminoglycoside phosphotransferase (APT) family kinase protein